MTDPEIWSDFLAEWSAWIPELFTTASQLASIEAHVPAGWISAIQHPEAGQAAGSLWAAAAAHLPRFARYVARETMALAIGRGEIGYALIYFVRACSENPVGTYHPGFVFGGTPSSDMTIDEFVRA